MKPMEGRASMTFSSSTTRSRWIGSGRTGCCGPKGMIVRAMVWVLGFGGRRRSGCRRRGRGGCRRRGCGLGDRRFGAPERELHIGLVEMPMEIHRHAIDLHVEQVVQLILIKEGAPIDGGDAWQPGPFGE